MNTDALDEASPERLAEVFKAAGEPIRARLLALLAHGERCVCELHGPLGSPQPTVSRHLSVLRGAGLVSARRQGQWVYYSLAPAAHRWLGPAIEAWRSQGGVPPREC